MRVDRHSRPALRRLSATVTSLLLAGGAVLAVAPPASADDPAAADLTVDLHENLPHVVPWAGADVNDPIANPEVVDAPQHGTVSCEPLSWACSYTPDRDYTGTDTFTWRIRTWNGDLSATATATMNVVPSPVAPLPSSSAGAAQLAAAMVADPSTLTGASVVLAPPSAIKPTGIGQARGGFPGVGLPDGGLPLPTDGDTFGVLGTGDVSLADMPQTYPSTQPAGVLSYDLHGTSTLRGDSAYDTTVIKLDLTAPQSANCLRLDFAFLSEEYPDFVGSEYDDAFIAELDHDTWMTRASDIIAPDNFAFDPSGDVVSINTTGALAMSQRRAILTAYNATTPVLQASTPVQPGAHSLYLSIFDQGDNQYDSAAFVDNIRFVHVADPTAGCATGAALPDASPVVSAGDAATGTEGSPVALTGSASDPESEPLTTTWSYTPGAGVDPSATCSFSAPGSTSTTMTCTDDGTYTATLTASDGVNDPVSSSTTVTVANAAPGVSISSPSDGAGVLPGSTVTLTAPVTDAGANDALTCSVDWGDGSTSSVHPSAGACQATHAYSASGTSTVTVTVRDDDGGSSSASVLVVVSSPNDKVTGGGWIADGAGRSSFGFVAKATKTGYSGELQVTTATHDVHCATVDSLAVLTDHATWSGQCTLDGVAGYRFVASAREGVKGGAAPHWAFTLTDGAGRTVLSQSADLGGGTITIH